MDKPTLPPLRELYADDANGVSVLGISDNDIAAYGEAMAAWGAAQERERIKTLIEQQRGMFVARLENLQENGDCWLSVASVLALLNDCDMLAQQHTKEIDHDDT